MSAPQDDDVIIDTMVDAITTIFAYIADQTLDTFLANRMMKDAVAKNLEVVGESANQLSTGLKDRRGHIPRNDISITSW